MNATYEGEVYNTNGITSVLDMGFVEDEEGRLSLTGAITSPDGGREVFSLAPRYYNKKSRRASEFLNPSKYTYIIPSLTTDSADAPAGDAIGYGSITSDGKVKIKGWSNAGYKYTYKGYLQNGNQQGERGNAEFQAGNYGNIPLYVQTYGEGSKNNVGFSEWMLGTVDYDMSGVEKSVGGNIRYVKHESKSSYYPSGFDQSVVMQGSKYSRAGYAGIPLNGYELFPNNATGIFEGSLAENLEPGPYTFSWKLRKGKMSAPKNIIFYQKGRFKAKHGLFTAKFVDYLIGKRLVIRGVVLQNKNITTGHAIDPLGLVSMRHRITPAEGETLSDNP